MKDTLANLNQIALVCQPYLLAIKTARVYHITRLLNIPNVDFLNNLQELSDKEMNL
jgi:hypothetical protein